MPNATLAESERSPMKDVAANFGVLIAFVLPGFVALWGLSYLSPTVAQWLQAPKSVNGFLFATLSSLALGVFLSGLRWLIFDRFLMPQMGVTRPTVDYAAIMVGERTRPALALSIEHTYRYFQFYANTAVALLGGQVARLAAPSRPEFCQAAVEFMGLALVALILVFSARDAFRNYCDDLSKLDQLAREGG